MANRHINSRNSHLIAWLALEAYLVFTARVGAQNRDWRETASETIWTGRYCNCDHGFYIQLPSGVLGHGTKAPSPNHGLYINLIAPSSERPTWTQKHRILWVNEDYVLEPGQDAYTRLSHAKAPMSNSKLRSHSFIPTVGRLGGLKAVFVRKAYTENGMSYLIEEIAALSHNKDIEYTVTLDTTTQDATRDEVILRRIITGFHTSKIDNSRCECSNE